MNKKKKVNKLELLKEILKKKMKFINLQFFGEIYIEDLINYFLKKNSKF